MTLPAGTAVTALKATFTLSSGASAKVGSTAQTSGVTENDFTSPVSYVVTGSDGTTTATYVVTVTVPVEAKITAYAIGEAVGTINESAKTIAVTVPYGTAVTALKATFTLSSGASAKVGSTAQVSGTTENDFTSPVSYVVTGSDSTTTATYVVTVTVAENAG